MASPRPDFSRLRFGWHWDGAAMCGGRCSSRRFSPPHSGRPPAWVSPSRPCRGSGLHQMPSTRVRYAIWFAFVASLLVGCLPRGRGVGTGRLLPRSVIAIVATALVASVALSDGYPAAQLLGKYARTVEFGLRLGLAVFGLILVEQLLRRAPADARWSIKHLCVGLAGIFAFDLLLLCRRDAVCPARPRHLGCPRRRQHAGHSFRGDLHGAEHRLDDRDAHVAQRRLSLDGAAVVRRRSCS